METTINYIRDVLRKEGITGMDSINHCIVFILCRMLDEDTCKKTKIDTKYAYENIMIDEDGDEIGDQELYGKIFVKGKDCLITEFINKLQFRNIKFKLEGIQNLKSIMNKMKKFNPKELSNVYDIIGTIYEIHLKSGTSNAMRDLGQYYTHRLIINYMIKLCDPKMEKGIVEKIVDPTMGTGGFLTMTIKYLNEKYKNKIDWTKNKTNIIGFDIDENVRNMSLLNVFLETGELMSETLCKQDTLHNDLKFADGTILNKAKVILANEPMGLKNIVLSSCCDRIKKDLKNGTKAEPLFLRLFMEALDDDGRCAVIVPDGMLFNDSILHNKVRTQIVENFNLKKIVSLSDDFFLNTGVKTSIIFFVNDGKKTSDVEFSSVKLKNENIEETNIIKVKHEDIIKNNYSLFVNKYNVKDIDKISGIEYKKLGDVCEFDKIEKHDTSYGKENGKYKFLTGGAKTELYCDKADMEKLCIIQNKTNGSGKCNLTIEKNFSCATQAIVYRAKNDENDITTKYIYYYLSTNINILEEGYKGSNHKNISKEYILNIEIPIPNIEVQKIIVETLDLIYSNIETSKKYIDETKNIIARYILCQTTNENNEKTISKLCNVKFGKRVKKDVVAVNDDYTGVKYPCYGGGNISFYMKEFNREGVNLLISRFGMSEKCVRLVNEKLWLNDSGFTLETNSDTLLQKYLNYYILFTKQKYIFNISSGSCQKNINMNDFNNMKIKIPSIEKQNKIIEKCNDMMTSIQHTENQIQNNTEIIKNIMKEYLKNNVNDNNDDNKENS